MKILYVSDLFSGIKPLISEGALSPKGSPAFFHPLKKIIDIGFDVDIFFPVIDNIDCLHIASPILKKCKIHLYQYNNNPIFRVYSDLNLIAVLIKYIKKNKYDFVYGHGSFGTYGTIAARITKTPCGARVYGSFLYYRLQQKCKSYIAFRYYRQYLPFIIKKNFLVVTNDGTRGDELKQLISKKSKYNFQFLLNGVDKDFYSIEIENDKSLNNVLLYAARIDEWKNQEFAIETIIELGKIASTNFELHIVGTIYNQEYWEKLKQIVKTNNIDKKVKYIGTLNKTNLRNYYKNCFAVMSFYKYSNLGNISIETLVSGGLLIAKNDGSLKNIVEHNINGLLVNSPIEAAKTIINLKKQPLEYNRIRKNSMNISKKIFQTWDERSDIEVDLINKAILNKR